MPFTVQPSDFLTSYYVGRKTITGGTMFVCSIDPAYCLDNTAAAALQANFADLKPGMERIPPLGPNWGGMFVQANMANPDNTVPWLQFQGASGNPVIFNAGVLANNYARGYDPAYAESLTRAQIQQAIAQG